MRQLFSACQERSTVVPTIPSPGGRVAPEGGRERNSGGKLEVRTTVRPDESRFQYKLRNKSEHFSASRIFARIPLQSPIGSEEPIGDS